jgi:hypothetical protein
VSVVRPDLSGAGLGSLEPGTVDSRSGLRWAPTLLSAGEGAAMNQARPEFGGRSLSDSGLSKHLDVLTAENRALDERLIRENNERLITEYIRRMWRESDAKTARV